MSDIQLLQGDCLDLMSNTPPKSIDLILCDLPYNCTHNSWDCLIPFDKLWLNYKRIIKDNGAIILFAQGLFYVNLVNSNPKMFKYDLVWDKQLVSGFLNAKRMPLRQHEQIAVFYNKLPTYNPQMTIGNPVHSKGTLCFSDEYTQVNNNYGNYKMMQTERTNQKYPKSIVSFQKPHPSKALHPTEKSVELCEWLIKTYSNEGDIVLDNCMGVGTTGIACVNTNRNFIGMELNDEYFNIAKERILEKNTK